MKKDLMNINMIHTNMLKTLKKALNHIDTKESLKMNKLDLTQQSVMLNLVNQIEKDEDEKTLINTVFSLPDSLDKFEYEKLDAAFEGV